MFFQLNGLLSFKYKIVYVDQHIDSVKLWHEYVEVQVKFTLEQATKAQGGVEV